jgi:hypothetical protein
MSDLPRWYALEAEQLKAEIERLRAGLQLIANDKHRLMNEVARQTAASILGGKPIGEVAEWPTREEAEKRAAELMTIGRATLSRSKHTPECSYWDGLMAQVCNCGATGHTSGSAL